jgi:hypothetical protein
MKVSGIRSLLACLTAVLSLTRADAGAPAFDLRGTARAGGRFIPNAVVWLDAPNPPGETAAGRVVLAAMGPLTAVVRLEQLDYDTRPPFDLHARRQTVGARILIRGGLSAQVNLLHQTGQSDEYGPSAVDIAVTYSVRMRPH